MTTIESETAAPETAMGEAGPDKVLWKNAIASRGRRLILGQPEFVVVGTGRCGTGYVASVLNEVGIRCGHEDVYGPDGVHPSRRLRGDASWLAAPSLDHFRGVVWHLVRHPIAVVQSFLHLGFFRTEPWDVYKDYAARFVPFSADELDTAIRWYVEWNRRCEAVADFRCQLEDIEPGLRQLAGLISSPRDYFPKLDRVNLKLDQKITDADFEDRIRSHARWNSLLSLGTKYGYFPADSL